jgi:DNA-binding NarL/FixJ family response regulator
MITVLIADDHLILRDILQLLLETAGDIQIVAMASNGQEAVEKAAEYHPDVVIMDVSLPVMNGVEATKQILAGCPETRVLMASAYDTPYHIRRSVQAGALGYLLKDVASRELVSAVRSIHNGNRYFSNRIAEIARYFIQ